MTARIENVDPEMIPFAQKALLKDKKIKVVVNRINKTKAGIRKNRAEHSDHYLGIHRWNADTAQVMADLDWKAQGRMQHHL